MGRRDGSKPVRNSVSLPAGIHLMPECRTCFRLLGFLFCFVFLPIHVTPGPALPSRLTDLMTMMWLPWRQNCRADGLSLRILPCSLKWRSTGHHGDKRWSSSWCQRPRVPGGCQSTYTHAHRHTHTHTHTQTEWLRAEQVAVSGN